MLLPYTVVGGYAKAKESAVSPETCINLFETTQIGMGGEPVLTNTPGHSLTLDLVSGGNIRASKRVQNKMYVVSNDKIYSIDELLVATELKTIFTTGGYVGIASNQTQVIFVDGADGWLLTISTGVVNKITAAGFPTKPEDVTYLDGYFIVNIGETNQWGISALNDGSSWDASDRQLINSGSNANGDILVAIRNLNRNLFLFGKNSIEIWEDVGASNFPFRPNMSLLIEHGTVAPGSVAQGEDSLFWLSSSDHGVGSVKMTKGTTPIPVSTPEIDEQFQSYSTVLDARAFVYKMDGHVFYEIGFETANKSWLYDATTQKWHQLEALNGDRHIANTHTFFNEKHYIGSRTDGKIYEFSTDIITADGIAIKRERIPQLLRDPKGRKIRINRMNMDFIRGIGTQNGATDDPTVFLSVSRDNGMTYSSIREGQIGKSGEYTKRTVWRRLGTAGGSAGGGFAFRYQYYGKTKFFMGNATLDIDMLED